MTSEISEGRKVNSRCKGEKNTHAVIDRYKSTKKGN